MAQQLDPNEIVTFKEMLMANSVMVDALAQVLIEKGVFNEKEFFIKLKQVQAEYESRGKRVLRDKCSEIRYVYVVDQSIQVQCFEDRTFGPLN